MSGNDRQGMRWKVTKAVRASNLPSPSKLIMLTLADIADVGTAEIPERWSPSLTVLAKEASLGRSTVAAHLRDLEDAGWIVRTRPSTGSALAHGERTRYQLTIPQVTASPDDGPSESETSPAPEPASPAPGQASPAPGSSSPAPGHRDRSLSDQGQISSDPPSSATPPKVSGTVAKKRATRIPDDFAVTDDMIGWARSNTPNVGMRETEAFIDYWRGAPDSKGKKLDWLATWRNWMRREQTRFEERGGRRTGTDLAVPSSVSAADGLPLPAGTGNARVTDAMRLAAHYAALDGDTDLRSLTS